MQEGLKKGRKKAKKLVVRSKNWKILTVGRKKGLP